MNLRTHKYFSLLLGVSMAALSACGDFLGNKTDISFIDIPDANATRVAYVPVLPEIKGFMKPIQVTTGFDNLIYVVDSAQAIVALDQSGNQVGRSTIVPGVKYVAQDRSLDLLALGITDTVINTVAYRLTTIYRLDMRVKTGNDPNQATLLSLSQAKIKRKAVHPFYFSKSSPTGVGTLQQVSFNAIAVLPDNRYYVTRSGPDKSTQKIAGPDDAVLLFTPNDQFITNIAVQGLGGASINNFFTAPKDITTLAKPPQAFSLPSGTREDFIVTSLDSTRTLKVQYIEVSPGADGPPSYSVKFFETGDTSKASGFLYEPDRFKKPQSVTYSGDSKNFIFVIDKDSVFQFTNTGLEGVAFGTQTKLQKVSFGGKGTGVLQFNRPTSVAYIYRTVYVADAGNGRVLRFKLTDDFR